MPRQTQVCMVIAIVAGIVSVHLWYQLREERAGTGQLQRRVMQLELAQVRSQAAALAAALPTQQVLGRQSSVDLSSMAEGAKSDVTAGFGRVPAMGQVGSVLEINASELMKDPEYREGLALAMRSSMTRTYPDLARELGLTPERAGKLMDLIVKHRLASATGMTAVGADVTDQSETRNALQQRMQQEKAEIALLLGDVAYQKWSEYQGTLAVRQQVSRLNEVLESSGHMLDQYQESQLIAALAEGQKRQAEDLRQLGSSSGTRDQAEMITDSVQRTQEDNRRALDVASSYINAQQLDEFRKLQNQQLSMMRAVQRAQRPQP
jgi:hypothetical protein